MQIDQFELHARIEQRHWWFVARRQIVRSLIEQVVPPHQGHLVLDVGCGTGANLAALSDGYRCVGVDTSADAVHLAARRFPWIDFVHGFAPDDVPEAIEQASLVMLNDVLEHVPDDFELMSRLLAAVRPGTHLLVTVPADMWLWSPHDESFGHFRRYEQWRFERVWAGLPVEPLLVSYFNSRLYPVVRWVRERNRRRGSVQGEAGTDFRMPPAPINAVLTRWFAGEGNVLLRALQRRQGGYRTGVSLIALLRRGEGVCELQHRPADVEEDVHFPLHAELSAAH
ncbi:MAG: class I SAM-dependent methyltransferase [Pirellulales bacterium]|nr:class I SAM-dependent methyltransferase [Pirellulales bacterium]